MTEIGQTAKLVVGSQSLRARKVIQIATASIVLAVASASCSRCSGSRTESPESDLSMVQMPGLPADPSDAGRQTIAGIDSDHDGVRDDLQRWIAIRFKDSEKKRAALRQLAMAIQQELLSADNPTQSIQDIARSLKATDCVSGVFGASNAGYRAVRELQAQTFNTADRSRAAIKVGSNFDGHESESMPLDQATSACAFDPAKMKD